MNAPDAIGTARPAPIILDETGAGRDRKKSIGGSDVAAVMGVSKWKTPFQLWEEKTGRAVQEITPEKEALFKRGKRWEEPAFLMLCDELAARGHTVELVGNSRRFQDGEHEFMTCEIDREVVLDGELVNIEIKSVHVFSGNEWGEMDTDEVPIYYASQVMHGLGITGRRLCVVGALFGADNIVPYIIERDDETIDAMRAKCVDFWTVNVQGDVAPDPVNMEDMLRIFARVNGRPAEVDEATAQALYDLAAVRSQIKAYEGDEESLKFKVCDGIRKAWGIVPNGEVDDNAVILFNGIEVGSWKKQARTSIDTKALRARYPQVADDVSRESVTRILKVKK